MLSRGVRLENRSGPSFPVLLELNSRSQIGNPRYHKSEAMSLSKRSMASDHNPQLPRLLSQNNISLARVRKDSLHALAEKSLRIPFSGTTARVYLREQAKAMRELVFRESPGRTPFNLCFEGWAIALDTTFVHSCAVVGVLIHVSL